MITNVRLALPPDHPAEVLRRRAVKQSADAFAVVKSTAFADIDDAVAASDRGRATRDLPLQATIAADRASVQPWASLTLAADRLAARQLHDDVSVEHRT